MGSSSRNERSYDVDTSYDVATNNIGLDNSAGSVVNTGSGSIHMIDAGATQAAFDFGNSIADRAFSTVEDNAGDALEFGRNAINFVSDYSGQNAALIETTADLARRSMEQSSALAMQSQRSEGESLGLKGLDTVKTGAIALAVLGGLYLMKGK